jgi:hypothetical protein
MNKRKNIHILRINILREIRSLTVTAVNTDGNKNMIREALG